MIRFNAAILAVICVTGLQAQVELLAGGWQTWVIASGSQMRVPAPPGKSDTAAELQWLELFTGSANDAARAQIGYWGAGSPGYRWIKIASQEMVAHNLAPALYTRGMALLTAAIYDATVLCEAPIYRQQDLQRAGGHGFEPNLLRIIRGGSGLPTNSASGRIAISRSWGEMHERRAGWCAGLLLPKANPLVLQRQRILARAGIRSV